MATWRTTARLVHSSLYRANHLRLRLLLQTLESRRRSSSRQERRARLCADPADPTFFAGLTGAFASTALARRLLQTSPAIEGPSTSCCSCMRQWETRGTLNHGELAESAVDAYTYYHCRTIHQLHCLGIVHCSHSPTVETIIYTAFVDMRFFPNRPSLCASWADFVLESCGIWSRDSPSIRPQ